MIVGVAFLPHPPFLVAGDSAPAEAKVIVEQSISAIHAVLAQNPDRVVVVGGWDGRADLGYAGVALPGAFSVGLGARWLSAAGWDGPVDALPVRFDADARECARRAELGHTGADRVGLLVMGDGSARRGLKAPGYVDERAQPFDQVVLDALAQADPGGLAALDPALAEELMVAGRAAWQVAAATILSMPAPDGRWVGDVRLAEDPFGVLYIVATWLPASASASATATATTATA